MSNFDDTERFTDFWQAKLSCGISILGSSQYTLPRLPLKRMSVASCDQATPTLSLSHAHIQLKQYKNLM